MRVGLELKSIMLKPLNNRVLVLPDPKKNETEFGFLLPDQKEKPITGTVVVGNNEVRAGQRVLFSLFALDEVVLDGKNHCVVSDKGILAVYE